MAKVVWSALVGDARGKVGSFTAVNTYAGKVLRRLVRTCQSSTATQLQMRAALGNLSTLWADPSMNANRADWVTLGLNNPEHDVFGADIYKTGLQWFIRCNKNRQTIGEAIRLDAPAWAAVDDPGALTLEYVTGPPAELNITATSDPDVGDAVVIMATRALSPGILTLGHQQRKIATINPKTNSPWNVITEYTARFGAPIIGKQIFVEVWYMDIDQGRIGLKSQAACIV
jgi:hypothetical protein